MWLAFSLVNKDYIYLEKRNKYLEQRNNEQENRTVQHVAIFCAMWTVGAGVLGASLYRGLSQAVQK